MEIFEELDNTIKNLENSIRGRVEHLKRLGKRFAEEGLAHGLELRERSLQGLRIVGVDGSRSRVEVLGSTAVYILRAVAVELGSRPAEFTRVVVVEDPLDENLEACAEDCMSYLETVAYGALPNIDYLVIDGPIADPPREQRYCSTHCVDGLHERRAKSLAEIVGGGGTVLGFVKRLRGSVSGLPAPIAFKAICSGVREALGLSRSTTIVIHNNTPAPTNIVEVYRRAGLRFSSFVVCDPLRDEPYRIDISPPESRTRALEVLISIPRTFSGLPLHVALAHQLARVPQELVELVRLRIRALITSFESML